MVSNTTNKFSPLFRFFMKCRLNAFRIFLGNSYGFCRHKRFLRISQNNSSLDKMQIKPDDAVN